MKNPTTEELRLADDGLVPSNTVPLRLYRQCLEVVGHDAAEAAIRLFEAHGWGGAWINGIYDYHHYHANAYEALAVVRGTAKVQFGGPKGPVVEIAAGDVVVIPPGVGHCRVEAHDLAVVGAYPEGQHDPDLTRASFDARERTLPAIARVPAPKSDPVSGGAFGQGL